MENVSPFEQALQGPVTLGYPLAVRYRVRNLALAEHFLSFVLGIPVRERGVGFLRFDNGSICLWVVQSYEPADESPITIMMASPDVPQAVAELSLRSEVTLIQGPSWTAPNRFEAELAVGSWLRLIVGRTYDEDELGLVPELRTELEWEESARDLLKKLLRRVPVSFRASAREKSVARAEAIAAGRGEVLVLKADGVRAIVEVTPHFQHLLLRDTLSELAEDLTPFAAHFAHLEEHAP